MTSSSPGTSGIWDNHHRGSIGEFLKEKILQGLDLSFVSAYFTIYAHAALKDEPDQIDHLRFLFGEPRFIQLLDPDKIEKKTFRIENDVLALENKLRQKHVAARELRRYRQFYMVYPQIWRSATAEFRNMLPHALLQLSASIRESVPPESRMPGDILITRKSFTHLVELIQGG